MAKAKKGDLITDLAGQLLSGSGVDLNTILDAAGDKLPQLLKGSDPYPMMTVAHFKSLRTRFKRNVPVNVTKKWIADALSTSQSNAEKVVIPSLDLLGLVNSQGKTTARASAFAKDSTYISNIKKMVAEVYPDELLDLNPNTKTDQTKISSFFKKAAGNNQTNGKKMETLYLHLVKESSGTEMAAANTKTVKDSKSSSAKTTDKTVSVTVKLEFPSKSMAQRFDEILTGFAEQVHAKVEKLD